MFFFSSIHFTSSQRARAIQYSRRRRGTTRVRRGDQSQIQRSQTEACGRSDQIRYELRRKNSDTDQIRYSAPFFFFFNQIRPDTARDPPVRDANGWHSPPPKHLPSPCFREGTHWPI